METAKRLAKLSPTRVLETAAETGIVTRGLRRRLPAGSALTATDLNRPMLDLAGAKFDPAERVAFEVADATALLFGESSFDAVVYQFGLMFFPDQEGSYRKAFRGLTTEHRKWSMLRVIRCITSLGFGECFFHRRIPT